MTQVIREKNKERFDKFFAHKDKIEEVLGELSWERLDDKKACRIAAYTEYTNDQDILAWSIKKLKSFRDCFINYVT